MFLEHGFAAATMRAIASRAGVSVPTVELLFGTKGRLLKAAIDVAIAGDDEPVPVLARSWAESATKAKDAAEFLAIVARVIGAAQQRSAGLVLALFEAANGDADLVPLAAQMTAQRARSATSSCPRWTSPARRPSTSPCSAGPPTPSRAASARPA